MIAIFLDPIRIIRRLVDDLLPVYSLLKTQNQICNTLHINYCHDIIAVHKFVQDVVDWDWLELGGSNSPLAALTSSGFTFVGSLAQYLVPWKVIKWI